MKISCLRNMVTLSEIVNYEQYSQVLTVYITVYITDTYTVLYQSLRNTTYKMRNSIVLFSAVIRRVKHPGICRVCLLTALLPKFDFAH